MSSDVELRAMTCLKKDLNCQ